MTTENGTTTKTKQAPAFYIFEQCEGKEMKRIGAAFKHGKGSGFNVVINGKRYAAFSPTAKTAPATETATEAKGA